MWTSGTVQAFSTLAHRCPQCLLHPGPADEWLCNRCGSVWNTFTTHGVCPGCRYEWTETQCLNCGEWSAHEAWYVASGEIH